MNKATEWKRVGNHWRYDVGDDYLQDIRTVACDDDGWIDINVMTPPYHKSSSAEWTTGRLLTCVKGAWVDAETFVGITRYPKGDKWGFDSWQPAPRPPSRKQAQAPTLKADDGENKNPVVGNNVGDLVHSSVATEDAKGVYCMGQSFGYWWLVWGRSTGVIRSRFVSRSSARSFMYALAENEKFVGSYRGEPVFTKSEDDELARCKETAREIKDFVNVRPHVSDRLKLAVVMTMVDELLNGEKS